MQMLRLPCHNVMIPINCKTIELIMQFIVWDIDLIIICLMAMYICICIAIITACSHGHAADDGIACKMS